jgi:hypothetical protein
MLKITFDSTKFLSFATFLERFFFCSKNFKVFFVNVLFVFMIKKIIGKFLAIVFIFQSIREKLITKFKHIFEKIAKIY